MGLRRLLLVVAIGLGLGMESAESQTPFDTYQEANALRKAGKLQQALTGFEKALQQAREAKDTRWVFYSAYRIGFVLSDLGEGERACQSFAMSLDAAIDADSGDVVRPLRRDRGDVVTCGLALTKLLTNRGLLTEAFGTQDRLNRFTNHWIESITGKKFDCLQDRPPIGLKDKPLAFVWRMRDSQSGLWDLTGRTVDATNLLRQTLTESPPPKAGTREDMEWQRTRNNLAVMLGFLGYQDEALNAYTALMEDRPGSRNAAYARFNGARLSSKIEGPSEKWLEEAKQGRAALAKLGISAREISRFDQTLASMEADLGRATEARKRLEAVKDAATARGDALIQLYVRRQLLIQEEENDESAMPKGDVEAGLLDLLQRYRSRGIRRGEPSVYLLYAEHLATEGRFPEAIAMIRQSAHLSEQFGWHLHLPRLWILKAAWHAELGQESEAAAIWQQIDALLEAHDDFPEKRRLEVLLAKMRWLASLKKMAEAKTVYEQASTLVAASTLTDYQKQAFEVLDIKALFALDDEANKVPVAPEAWADLQPLAVRSVALPGLQASAVYLLSNSGVLPISGKLMRPAQLIRQPGRKIGGNGC